MLCYHCCAAHVRTETPRSSCNRTVQYWSIRMRCIAVKQNAKTSPVMSYSTASVVRRLILRGREEARDEHTRQNITRKHKTPPIRHVADSERGTRDEREERRFPKNLLISPSPSCTVGENIDCVLSESSLPGKAPHKRMPSPPSPPPVPLLRGFHGVLCVGLAQKTCRGCPQGRRRQLRR